MNALETHAVHECADGSGAAVKQPCEAGSEENRMEGRRPTATGRR